ncbi:MAG TPA: hypothetical protein DEQ56_06015 [Bacteroidetes bacterium]|jgi:hypothetical protein|nr:hypothetical protein [Bacteroidota bacterium]
MQQEIALFRTTKGFQQNHKTTELKCKCCKSHFLANRKTAQFCSSSCRSNFWMTKNQKKVITIAVPIDIDESYLEKIKNMLINYKTNKIVQDSTPVIRRHEERFNSEKDLREFMKNSGFPDYKIPKHDLGIYYDDGLSITKFEDGWQVKIAM